MCLLHASLARKRILFATAMGGTGCASAVLRRKISAEISSVIVVMGLWDGLQDSRSLSVLPVLFRVLLALPSELLRVHRSGGYGVDPVKRQRKRTSASIFFISLQTHQGRRAVITSLPEIPVRHPLLSCAPTPPAPPTSHSRNPHLSARRNARFHCPR